MKNKVAKIIFIISFAPYLLILITGIISAFSGASFIFNTIYGMSAFNLSVLLYLYDFTLIIPIIPICLLFQICYIFRKKIKIFKSIKTNRYIRNCCIISSLLILILMIFSYSFEIEKIVEKISAKQMIKNAEEKISFNEGDTFVGGIFNMPEYEHEHIFIDYDKYEVGMLLNVDNIDEFWKVKLQETTKDSAEYTHIVNDYFMQADIPLSYPGQRLISFYEDKPHIHRTIAFLLICENGTLYYTDNIKEKDTGFTRFTGLNFSEFFVGENVKFSR